MRRPPHDPKAPVLGWRWWLMLGAIGSYLALATLLLFNHYLGQGAEAETLAVAQTMAFTGLIIMEKVNVFNFRSLRDPLHTVGFFSNPWLLLAVAGSIGLQVAAVYVPFLQTALQTVPLGWNDWLLIALVAAPVFIVPEGIKLVLARRSKHTPIAS
jgi:Ca2+-transporting ATPase